MNQHFTQTNFTSISNIPSQEHYPEQPDFLTFNNSYLDEFLTLNG